jgi:hypothetical protein
MASTAFQPGTAGAILSRVIRPKARDLSPAAAEAFLAFAFAETDRDRMHELARKNQAGSLTESERFELETYLQIGMMLDLLQAKARLTLSRGSERRD